MQNPSAERIVAIGLAIAGIALVAVLILGTALGGASTPSPTAGTVAQATPTSTDAAAPTATATATGPASAGPSDTSSGSATATPVLSPTPVPTPPATPAISPQLPAMLAAIGDSYTQAWSVSPAYKRDHPGYSWAVGTYKHDGVFSLLERFQSLGDNIRVEDAATSGKKMDDAARQATRIVASAATLPPGSTVYLTFELGTNDLCDTPTTDPAAFEAQLRAAVEVLRSGLPAGSRILMLSVPDFSHFSDITQANSAARALLGTRSHSQTCAPFLGSDSPLSLQAAELVLTGYDAILFKVCDEIEAADGQAGRLHCLRNDALLAERNFTINDLSTVDYFHPSISGQAKMAASAWTAGPWGKVRLPSGAAALAPSPTGGGDGNSGGAAFAGLLALSPLAPFRRLRRRGGPTPAAPRAGRGWPGSSPSNRSGFSTSGATCRRGAGGPGLSEWGLSGQTCPTRTLGQTSGRKAGCNGANRVIRGSWSLRPSVGRALRRPSAAPPRPSEPPLDC